ncbi:MULTISPECIES: MmcQ/YjbR family DNA-binding protein [unclassified Enterococcus]|uniref:MmcQ/YjbR family DNA-binding protein n=1 Tax=unclassified Enterococcus TaxID=2608891 RepID=UPI0013ED18FE|nr:MULTISPECIES: MmcQ/YjbR family DNA-binding protein [unclassified Enterococcus]
MATKQEIIDYIEETYQLNPEHVFKKFPDYCVFRHRKNKKWFGLLMNIPEEKLYGSGTGAIDIIDLKVEPELGGLLRGKEGYFQAYHMNKEHWITVDIRKIKNPDELMQLIDASFELTQK